MPDNLDELRHIEGFPLGKDEGLLVLDWRLRQCQSWHW